MSYHEWAYGAWGMNLSESFPQDKEMMAEMHQVIEAHEGGGEYPESFLNDDGEWHSRYAFLDNCPNTNQAVMKLYGERIARKFPFIYDLLKAGAHFMAAPSDASEYAVDVFLGWGLYALPIPEGTKHLPEAFMKESTHWTWVVGG